MSKLSEIYYRCDVSNNRSDDPLSESEFEEQIKALFIDIVDEAEAHNVTEIGMGEELREKINKL